MRFAPVYRICEVCGRGRGRNYDHSECSKKLKATGKYHERKRPHKSTMRDLMQDLQWHLDKDHETPAYLENGLDYRALQRFKSGGQG